MERHPVERAAIEQAALRYARAFDTGDVDGFVDLFTADGTFEAYLTGQEEPLSRCTGRAELAEFVRAGAPGGGEALHHVSPLLFEDDGPDGVRTRSTLIITRQLSRGPAVVAHGVYHDTWVHEEGQWRLSLRTFVASGYLLPRSP